MRLREAADRMRERLRAAGLDTPDLDARVLTAAAAGRAPQDILLRGQDTLTPDQVATVEAYTAQRLAHVPVSRILGRREFWGLSFEVTPDTLVPRPDTETLVDAALAHIDGSGGRGSAWRIADLGTGTGAILAALLSECPAALGWGIDRSPGAAGTARRNLDQLGLGTRAHVLVGDWAEPLTAGALDLIASNPPYIASAEIAALEPEVARHDPIAALDGGDDGLEAYRRLLPSARRALRPGAPLLLEVGETQAGDVHKLLADAGFLPAGPPRRDLAGHARVVVALAP